MSVERGLPESLSAVLEVEDGPAGGVASDVAKALPVKLVYQMRLPASSVLALRCFSGRNLAWAFVNFDLYPALRGMRLGVALGARFVIRGIEVVAFR